MSEVVIARFRVVLRALYALVAAVIFLGDQLTKAMVKTYIPEHAVIPIIPGFLNLIHTRNPGAAFGLFSDSPAAWKTGLLILISVALLAAVIVMVWRTPHLEWESGVGLALILGGALSNLVDRVHAGRVVDFADVYFRTYHWPAFNLADSAIVVGAGFLIIQILFGERR